MTRKQFLLRFFIVYNISINSYGFCESSKNNHRVRRFVLTKNSKVSFDVELMLPIPSLGGVDVQAVLDFPLSITMLNDTLIFNSNRMPLLLMPGSNAMPVGYPSYIPNYYSYDTFYGSSPSPYFHVMKRSLAAASAQHRYDLFFTISETLNRYGIDGDSCIKKTICELASAPLMIESPLHEILEHILTISRSYDEDGLLDEFLEAEKFGRSGEDCITKYESCQFGIFESVD